MYLLRKFSVILIALSFLFPISFGDELSAFHYEFVIIDGTKVKIDRVLFPETTRETSINDNIDKISQWIDLQKKEGNGAIEVFITGSFNLLSEIRRNEFHFDSGEQKLDIEISAGIAIPTFAGVPKQYEMNDIYFHYVWKGRSIDTIFKDTYKDNRIIPGKRSIVTADIESDNPASKGEPSIIRRIELLYIW